MKSLHKFRVATGFAILALLLSCSSDDEAITGQGKLNLEFDQVFGGADLILRTQANALSNGEILKVDELKYIVSNIRLTKSDGTVFTYPKSASYFIVDESDVQTQLLTLDGVPAGDYVSVTFGIGVDQEQFNLGAAGQGNFLALAEAESMMWSWSAGYKFVLFEGTFTTPTQTDAQTFMVHTGRTGIAYNYTEVTLALPQAATVRKSVTPQIHIFADAKDILDGQNKVSLEANSMMGMGAMIMGGAILGDITSNVSQAFEVDHVHND
ncbi:MbnP family protein [Flavobacterium sp.]|uniref:MbnP family protein n=1 Tax=Flavobacterium sp. TaxID=239 RepID=UPI002624F386|nr:MbnP family protein [Flavobacterium sp.]